MSNAPSMHRPSSSVVYNRARYAAEMREALERWAERVAAILAQKSAHVDTVMAAGGLFNPNVSRGAGGIYERRLAR